MITVINTNTLEVSASGIYAWKLPTAGPKDNPRIADFDLIKEKLGFVPYFPDASQTNPIDKRMLLSDVSEAYDGVPFSNEIGWAFSENGHEAQNVIIKTTNVSSGSGFYNKSYRYSINISADDVGNPISAVILLEDSGWCWSNHIQNYMRVPKFTEGCGIRSERLYWYTTGETPPESNYVFPVHVFYSGNSLVAINYEFKALTTTAIDSRKPAGVDLADPLEWPGLVSEFGQVYWGEGGTKTISKGRFLVDGADTEDSISINNSSLLARYSEGANLGSIHAHGPGNTGAYVFSNGSEVEKYLYLGATYHNLCFSALTIPHFNREAYYYNEARREYIEPVDGPYFTNDIWALGGTRHSPVPSSNWSYYVSGTTCVSALPHIRKAIPSGEEDPYPPTDLGSTTQRIFSASFPDIYNAAGPSSCAEPNGTRYIYYGVSPIYAPFTRTINELIEEPGDFSFTYKDIFVYATGSGSLASENLDHEDNLGWFDGDLVDDQAMCPSYSSPAWLGSWIDPFSNNGWASAGLMTEITTGKKLIIGSIGEYLINTLPSNTRSSGWFGIPFI